MFKSAVAKLAHSSTIPALAGNSDLRPLQEIITTEKLVLQSLQRLSTDFAKSTDALRTWACSEGEDLEDTVSACVTLLNHWVSSLTSFASHIANVRGCLKAVRTREEALDEMRRNRKSLASKADSADKRLGKMSPENRSLRQQTDLLMSLRDQIRGLDVGIVVEEASLGDWKRVKAREWMGVLFDGLFECSEKGSVVATSARAIIECVPTYTTQPGLPRVRYSGHSQVQRLAAEAEGKLQRIPGDIPGLSPPPPSLSILQTPIQPTQPYASSTLPNIPPSDLYEPSDFGEYNPYSQSQTYTPGQRARLSSFDQSTPASPTGSSPFTPFHPQVGSGFTASRQPSLSAGREHRRVSFVGEVGDGTPQPSSEFRIDDIPELPPSPPSLPIRPPTDQLAQKLAAAEKKLALYAELAGRLQAACDTGGIGVDPTETQAADRVLGSEITSDISTQDSNDRNNWEAGVAASSPGPAGPDAFSPLPSLSKESEMLLESRGKTKEQDEPLPEYSISNPYPACEICFEPFQVTHSPVSASQAANSSGNLPFGLRLPCPGQHPYCISCLAKYIKGKLNLSETGDMNTHTLVFPICCPGCPVAQWETAIQDDEAEKVLDRETMSDWHHRKLLDSLPRQYCPNPKCSALLQSGGDSGDPKARCPACFEWVCVPCKVVWHNDMSCEKYQSLPLDERTPEDRLAIELAESKQWRRCPGCHAIVERTRGCDHMTCLCREEFCFKCGSLWDTRSRKCTSNPPCKLRGEMVAVRSGLPLPTRPQAANFIGGVFQPPVHEPPHREPLHTTFQHSNCNHGGDFSWIDNTNIASFIHPFTSEMVNTLTCGYCNGRLRNMNDLRLHLSSTRDHPVFSCCGRFFKRENDLERHQASKLDHSYTVIRNT